MERKTGRKLELNRETLRQLERQGLEEAQGGLTTQTVQTAQTASGTIVGTALTCVVSCGGSCVYTCPGISC